jgi:MbtH protein
LKYSLSNPFDEVDGQFYVLINSEKQYSLWPGAIDIPAGWQEEFRGQHGECVGYIDTEWTDMRPESLRRQIQMGSASSE